MAYQRLKLAEHFAEQIMDEWNWHQNDKERTTPELVQFHSELKRRLVNYKLGLTPYQSRQHY